MLGRSHKRIARAVTERVMSVSKHVLATASSEWPPPRRVESVHRFHMVVNKCFAFWGSEVDREAVLKTIVSTVESLGA